MANYFLCAARTAKIIIEEIEQLFASICLSKQFDHYLS